MTIDGAGGETPQLDLADRAMTQEERQAILFGAIVRRSKGLHAAEPGTGPAGETCGSCAHLARKLLARTYLKCGLCRKYWTGGGGTDVKARDRACSKWAPR
jgi:hypothetical protein